MGLGGEVDHCVVAGHDGRDHGGIADVTGGEGEPGAAGDGFQVRQVASVGQLVQYGHPGAREPGIVAGQDGSYKM